MCLLRESIEQSDVYSTHDFAERLTLMFNEQALHEYFNGGATISMEVVVIIFFPAGRDEKQMEFHTHLSDAKLQDSSIVHSHMDKSIWFSKEKDIINDKTVLYCHTDG